MHIKCRDLSPSQKEFFKVLFDFKRILLNLVRLKLFIFFIIFFLLKLNFTLTAVVTQPDLIWLITAIVHLLVRVMFTLRE